MSTTTIRRVADGAWCFLAIAALWALSRTLPGIESITPVMLLIAGSILLLSIVDGSSSPIILGVPALMLVMLLLRDERGALFSSGVVLAGSLALAGWRWVEDGRIGLGRALVLEVAALGPAVAAPSDDGYLLASAIAGAGAIAIVVASSRDRQVGLDTVMLAYCAALVAPGVPLRSSLFAFVIAAVILVVRRPGVVTVGLLVAVIVAAGKWYLPLLLALAAGFAFHRYRVSRSSSGPVSEAMAVPFVSGIPVAVLSSVSLSPDVWARIRGAGTPASVAALTMVAGSLLVQPSLATLYVVTAITCLVAGDDCDRHASPALFVFVMAMAGLTAWSGVLSGSFPLPIPLAVTVLLAMGATLVVADRLASSFRGSSDVLLLSRPGRLASALVAGTATTIVLLHPLAHTSASVVASDVRIASGETASVDLPTDARVVVLRISGGNVAHLRGGTVVGRVTVEGREAHELRIGDFADWGANRREHYLPANNPRPAALAGRVIGRGSSAFLSGTGLVRFDVDGASSVTIEALREIGERGRLIVESVEVER